MELLIAVQIAITGLTLQHNSPSSGHQFAFWARAIGENVLSDVQINVEIPSGILSKAPGAFGTCLATVMAF